MTKKITVKIVEYRLAKDADEGEFLRMSKALTPKLAKLHGFIKRELHKGEDGRWRDVVYWQNRASADKSEFDIPTIPECVKCIALMDHSDMTVTHFEQAQ